MVVGGLATSLARPSIVMAASPGVVGIAPAEAGDGKVAQRRRAVAAAVQAATGAESPQQAMAALFRPEDTVGIKLNCLGGPRMSPSVELVEELVELIAAAGVQRNRIIVFERSSRELERAGFRIRRSGGPYLCFGTDNDYERRPSTSGEIGSCFARLVSDRCTALVSFGVVKDHDLAGVSASLKNWYGVIHNPNKYHDSNCNPYVADVVRHTYLRSKLRLTVLDGVDAQCHGGPAFASHGLFELGTVAASTDPVAADVWAWRQIDAERVRRGLPPLVAENREPRFLATAARYGLGVADPQKLRVVTA
jgi:uncharacterized protein (DUF362 family)